MKVHYSHPCFASTTACGRPMGALHVSFGGPVITCASCRRVLLRLISVAPRNH